jgi:uncharacterized protein YbjT (DUF2867 family)
MKTVLVVGATGAQGGSVARHLSARGFNVRTLSRKPGATFVGDLSDVSSLQRAVEGCDAVFGVTNYWEHFDRELVHGSNLIQAVSNSDAFLVLSTLPPAEELSHGELTVPHFEMKALLEKKARQILPSRSSFIHVAFYYENFLSWFLPQAQADGSFALGFPQGDTPLAAVSVEDVGLVVADMLASPRAGEVRDVVGDNQPVSHYAAVLARIATRPVRYSHVPREVFARLGFPGAEDLADMFDLNRRFILSRPITPGLSRFEQWARRNEDAILRALKASCPSA